MRLRRVAFWLNARSFRLLAFQSTFHGETRLVQIDVVVRDKNGPVRTLVSIAARVADRLCRKNLVWLTANLPFSAGPRGRIIEQSRSYT